MANEITLTSHNDTFLAAELTETLMEEIRPNFTLRQYMDEQVVRESNVKQWSIQDDPGAAAAKTEASDLSNTAATTSNAQATLATVGIMFSPTDEVRSASKWELVSWTANVAKRSVLEKLETDLGALLDDATNVTSTTGVDLTADTLFQADAALTGRDIVGSRVFVGSDSQYTDLQRDMAASLAPYYGKQAEDAVRFGTDGRTPFAVGSITVTQTSVVPTANSGADDVGCVFVPKHSFGLAVAVDPESGGVWLPRVRFQRDESNNLTEIICTGRYGGKLIRDNDAQEVNSDA